jgi:hypothetical protein
MDNKKFEQLMDLVINEDIEKAHALFHDIVVEKSREIYEGLMDEELGSQDQVGGLLDEIGAEEEGIGEGDGEEEFDGIEGDDQVDLDSDEFGGEEGEEDLEDRVVDLEDKLDELMAEFEELMAKEEGGEEGFGDEEGEEGFGDEEGGEEFGGEEGDEMMESSEDDEEEVTEAEEDDDEEESLEESVQLQKVSVTHGDNGAQTRSPALGKNTKISANGAKVVSLGGGETGGKGGTQGGLLNPTTKDLKGAGSFKNAPGKGNFSEKGEAAPKPKHGDDGQNTKSVLESRRTTKKRI